MHEVSLWLRMGGLLALIGVIGAGFLVVATTVVLVQHGVDSETWWRYGLVFLGVIWMIAKRDLIIKLVAMGLTGKHRG